MEEAATVLGGNLLIVGPQLVQGAVPGAGVVHKYVPVVVFVALIAAQKVAEGVPAPQNVGGVVHDQVLIVHPAHQVPGCQGIDLVINENLGIGVGGQGVKEGIALHLDH